MENEDKIVLLGGLACVVAILRRKQNQRRRAKRRFWVHPIYQLRKSQGHYENLVLEMRLSDSNKFFNFTRMSASSFDLLLSLVKPKLKKHSHREPINEGCRLMLTLRFLATGDSYPSLSYAFRIAPSTVCVIIRETCRAIWTVLQPLYLKPPTEEKWKEIASDFYTKWNFPNCIGAIDGKHVTIQAPANSGSSYYNYKKAFSINLLAVCDANYMFTYVDIGAFGSQSDGGVLNASQFGKNLMDNKLNIPLDSPFPRMTTAMPYFFVADEAFPLRINIMRPFSKRKNRNMPRDELIYNYRLSRARRTIENAFGILAARFRIYHRVINAAPETVDAIVQATVCLHNFIMNQKDNQYCSQTFVDREVGGQVQLGEWRNSVNDSNALQALSSHKRLGARNSNALSTSMRDYLKRYVNEVTPDLTPWQRDLVP